jgi:energy-coupling factor transporter transmembrane protein EcfT
MRLRVGPLSLLAGCLLPVVGAMAISQVDLGLTVLGLQLLLLGWLLVDVRATLFRLGLGMVAAVSITVSTYLYGGQHLTESLGAACRVLAIVLPAALLTPRIGPSSLGDHLGQRLHLPARTVVAAVVALQRLDQTAEQWRQIQRARRSRGLGVDGSLGRRLRSSGGAAFAMLVVNMRQTGTLTVAMDSRGFADARNRTWAEPAPWHVLDNVVLALSVVLAVVPWILR